MLIANPIYDTVFKYLLEDIEIARGLLSTIIGKEIIEISVKPQETVVEDKEEGKRFFKVYRLDFKALIKTSEGTHQQVLIELQKSKRFADIMRFRKYLAQNYSKEETIVNASGKEETLPIPIITIYFLGFDLEYIQVPIFKVNNCLQNVITGEPIVLEHREQFIDLLNHECYTIQIPFLKYNLRTKLEKVLMVFSQEYTTEDKHKLNFQGEQDDPLVQQIVNRLSRAVASEEMQRKMDVEDELERIYNREMKALVDKVVEKEGIIDEQQKALEQKDKALEQKDKDMAALLKELEDLKKNR